MDEDNYPEPICQNCGNYCYIFEEVEVYFIGKEHELWCYCLDCDIETFHPIK